MANVLVKESSMTAIADAIRAKKGVSTKYKPDEMPSAISTISGSGITPTGTIDITSNGTHDVTNYASANVNVPTSGGGGITPTGTKQISITENGTVTEDVTNYASAEITVNVSGGGGTDNLKALMENSLTTLTSTATSVKTGTFQLSELQTAKFPNLITIKSAAFASCTKLVSIELPLVNTIELNAFTSNTSLVTLVLPSVTTFGNTVFNGCSKLKTVDMNSATIGNSCFYNCVALDTVIIRGDSVATLKNGSVFALTKFDANKAGGTIYVPQAMISQYQSATNWSTLFSNNANNQILPIEGSIYENAYADGTQIS